MSDDRANGLRADTAIAIAVSLLYSIAKLGHAIDGRTGIPGGPTIVGDATAGTGDTAAEQWTLVALGVVAAAIALWSGVAPLGVLTAARWIVVTGVALLITVGALVILFALFETDHPLRWSQPIAAALSCVGAAACASRRRGRGSACVAVLTYRTQVARQHVLRADSRWVSTQTLPGGVPMRGSLVVRVSR